MSKEDIKKFIKSQTIEVKVDPKTGIAKGTLFQKPKIVPSNNPTIKVGQTLSGKIDFKIIILITILLNLVKKSLVKLKNKIVLN